MIGAALTRSASKKSKDSNIAIGYGRARRLGPFFHKQKRMLNFFKKSTKKGFTPGISGLRGLFSGKFFGGGSSNNNASYERYVQRSIDLISQEIASAHIRLYKAKTNGEKEEVLDHEFLKLWNNPNPDMTRGEVLEHLSSFLDIEGNSYLLKAKDGAGKTREIYPLRADWVKVVPSTDENPERLVSKYIYSQDGKQGIDLDVEDIVPIRLFSPFFFNKMTGKGTVEGAKSIIDEEKTISEWNRTFFEKGAITSGVLEVDGAMEPEEKAAFEAQWKQEVAGMRNNGSTPILYGAKYTPTQFTQRELAFIDQRKLNRDDIFLLFGVPKALMMSEDVNLANSKQALWAFTRFTVRPRLKKIEDAINRHLLPEFGEGLTVEFDNPVPNDRDAEIKEYQAAIGNWMTPNEIRAEEGLTPLDGGDELTRPSALPPLQLSIAGESKKKDAVEIPDDRKERGEKAWHEMLKGQMPAEGKYQAALKKYFHELRGRVLQNLPDPAKAYGQKDTRLSVLEPAEEVAIMVDILTPLQRELFEQQARMAQKELGLATDYVITPTTGQVLEKYNLKLSKEVTKTTETAISQLIADATEQGFTIGQLTEQINRYFDYADATRAERIARSETIRTSNAAMESAWKQSDVVEAKEWYTAEDERVCEYCSEMDGRTEDLGAAFFKKGDTFNGLTLDYRDITEPPLHTSCRCVLLPVLK